MNESVLDSWVRVEEEGQGAVAADDGYGGESGGEDLRGTLPPPLHRGRRSGPRLVLSGSVLSLASSLGVSPAASHVSITHDGDYAFATVMLVGKDKG